MQILMYMILKQSRQIVPLRLKPDRILKQLAIVFVKSSHPTKLIIT
jgi:hypothetical protein